MAGEQKSPPPGGRTGGGLLDLLGQDTVFWGKVKAIELGLNTMKKSERKALFEALDSRYCLDCGGFLSGDGEQCDCPAEGDEKGKDSGKSK